MSRLLILGVGPLLEEGVRNISAQCLRTWFFTKPLLDDGHEVRLVTLPIVDATDPYQYESELQPRAFEGFEYETFTNSHFPSILRTLGERVAAWAPDALVGVNMLGAWTLAQLPSPAPLWADLNGYEMTEKQGQAASAGDDEAVEIAWRREALVARRADKFSTVSRPQLHALLGEMALLGRLNRHTFHYHFVHHVPNAYHPLFAQPAPAGAKGVLRGGVAPDDAFILLMSGAYNYWMDPTFLFDFLERTMAASDRVHFVSTGGGIAGYNSRTYEDFQRLIEASPHRERYHLLGWVAAEDLPGIYSEADLGLNVDDANYETLFGARNRLNNMMAAGIAVLTTAGSEISVMIDEAQCGIVCPSGDVESLVRGVLGMVHAPDQRLKLAERARRFALGEFSPEAVTEPLREWARDPRPAPDNAERLRRRPGLQRLLSAPGNRLEKMAQVAVDHDILAMRDAYVDLRALRSKLWYRALKTAKAGVLKIRSLAMRGKQKAAK